MRKREELLLKEYTEALRFFQNENMRMINTYCNITTTKMKVKTIFARTPLINYINFLS